MSVTVLIVVRDQFPGTSSTLRKELKGGHSAHEHIEKKAEEDTNEEEKEG